jgi:putative ABC transport system permease protein
MPDRIYRLLLKLLPAEFRGDYGDDMESTFRAERRQARGFPLARLWAGTLADLFRAAPAQHWDILAQDARFALRTMRARPALTAAAVLTLGLGIGANAAMFAVVDAVLLAPLPYGDPDRLTAIQERAAGGEAGNVGYLTFLDLRARARGFSALAAASQSVAVLAGDGRDAERVGVMRVSASYFPMVGVAATAGRTFTEAEDRPGAARRVVILSDRLWRRRFRADPSVVGKPLALGSASFTVVGVMPRSFEDLVARELFEDAELWTPLGYDPAADYACRTCRHLRAFGRLAPGVDRAEAEGEVSAILRGLAAEHPRDYNAPSARVQTWRALLLGPVQPVLLALWAGVGVLLLAACANVANLLLLRAGERSQEVALRTALGVTPSRLARQLLTESLLLAAGGGLAGLLPAWAAVRALAAAGPAQLPRLADASLDPRAVAVVLALTALSGILFGLVPLRQLAREDVAPNVHGAGRRTEGRRVWRLRSALVAGNVAMASLLLVGAGLLVRTLAGLLAVDPGFDPSRVLTLRVEAGGPRLASADPAQAIARTTQFYADVLARVRALPGVEAASATTTLPLGGGLDQFGFHIASRLNANPEEAPSADRFAVMPGFFETLRIPLLRGRLLDERDAQGAPAVAVVNRAIAEQLFPGEDALGHQVMLGPPDAPPRTIVGVVGDVRHAGLHLSPALQVYVPQAQWVWAEPALTLTVRGARDAASLAGPVREVVRGVDPAQAVSEVRPYEEVVAGSIATRRFACALLAVFAGATLLLAMVGLYGALGVLVSQRRREIGVRLALGAAAAQIVRQGLRPVAVGLLIGLLAAALSVRALGALLYGVTARDPATFAAAALVLAACAWACCLVPAWRAARIDPAVTLRAE